MKGIYLVKKVPGNMAKMKISRVPFERKIFAKVISFS